MLLFGDSLMIYEGRKLRPLAGWDGGSLFSFHPKYAVNLKLWKKKERVDKGKKANAAKRSAGKAKKKSVADLTPMPEHPRKMCTTD